MSVDHNKLIADLENIISSSRDRYASPHLIADTIRRSGNYSWVGLYDVDHAAGIIKKHRVGRPRSACTPTISNQQGLTGVAVAEKRTVNVGDVSADRRYLTAFGSTKSEIIVPVFDRAKEKVIGTIDIESELRNAFTNEMQALLERCADVIDCGDPDHLLSALTAVTTS